MLSVEEGSRIPPFGGIVQCSVHKLASMWMSREDLRARGCLQDCSRGVAGPGWVIVLCASPGTPIAYRLLLRLPSLVPLLVPSCGGGLRLCNCSQQVFSPTCPGARPGAMQPAGLVHRAELPFTLSVGCWCCFFLFCQRLSSHGSPE